MNAKIKLPSKIAKNIFLQIFFILSFIPEGQLLSNELIQERRQESLDE